MREKRATRKESDVCRNEQLYARTNAAAKCSFFILQALSRFVRPLCPKLTVDGTDVAAWPRGFYRGSWFASSVV